MKSRLLWALTVTGICLAPAAASEPPGKGGSEPQIAFEVRLIRVPADRAFKGPAAEERGVALLNDDQFKALLAHLKANPRSNILQTPRVTTFDDQPATIRHGERREFVTGLDVVRTGGKSVLVPSGTTVELGER